MGGDDGGSVSDDVDGVAGRVSQEKGSGEGVGLSLRAMAMVNAPRATLLLQRGWCGIAICGAAIVVAAVRRRSGSGRA